MPSPWISNASQLHVQAMCLPPPPPWPKMGETYVTQTFGNVMPLFIWQTLEDKKNVGTKSEMGDAIEYNPSKGFPSYFFRPRTADQFIPPAVMVQFRTIRQSLGDPQTVRLTCTAWGKAFDPLGQPVNENMFRTSFVFRIH